MGSHDSVSTAEHQAGVEALTAEHQAGVEALAVMAPLKETGDTQTCHTQYTLRLYATQIKIRKDWIGAAQTMERQPKKQGKVEHHDNFCQTQLQNKPYVGMKSW